MDGGLSEFGIRYSPYCGTPVMDELLTRISIEPSVRSKPNSSNEFEKQSNTLTS